MQDTNQFRNRF
jgi:hypothetical protein